MSKSGIWENPDDFKLSFRSTTSKYADAFIEKGSIKFNTPKSWVEYSIKNGEGRGDRLEGTRALCHMLDIKNLVVLKEKYQSCPELDRMSYKNKLYLKNKRTMELPCFCFYIMKNRMFEIPSEEGMHTMNTNLPASYFRDFMDDKTPDEIEMLGVDEKPALVIINDFDEFRNRLLSFLCRMGLDESEIIFTRIVYYDFDKYGKLGWYDFCKKSPNELSIKNIRFENQSEARVIINTDKVDIKKQLIENPIEIGSMKDIATVYKGYLYDGMYIKMEGRVIAAD